MALDLEQERKQAESETAPVEAPPEVATTDTTQFTSEGPFPAVASDTQAADQTASQQAFDQANQLDSGMHAWYVYKEYCELGDPQRWQNSYQNGYSTATGFEGPDSHGRELEWKVKANHSASQALREFMTGLTIADYPTMVMAKQVDGIRDTVGDDKFDSLFGSNDRSIDATIPAAQRLTLSSALQSTQFEAAMWSIIEASNAPEIAAAEPEAPVVEELEEQQELAQTEEPAIVADELALPERERVA